VQIEKEYVLIGVYTVVSLFISGYLMYLAWINVPDFLAWLSQSLDIKMAEIVKKLMLGIVGACGTAMGAFIAIKIRTSIEVRGLIVRLLTLNHAIEGIASCQTKADVISLGGVGKVLFHEKEISKISKYTDSLSAYMILKVISAMKYVSDPATQISAAECSEILSQLERPDLVGIVKELRLLVFFSQDLDEAIGKLAK